VVYHNGRFKSVREFLIVGHVTRGFQTAFLCVPRDLSERNERVAKYSFNINPVHPVNPVKKQIDDLLLLAHPAHPKPKHDQNG